MKKIYMHHHSEHLGLLLWLGTSGKKYSLDRQRLISDEVKTQQDSSAEEGQHLTVEEFWIPGLVSAPKTW